MAKWLKSQETVSFTVQDMVARITLNRPEKRNALNDQVLQELAQALYEADDLKNVSVIILEGNGKDFCAGYDLLGAYGGAGEGPKLDYDPADYRNSKSFDDDTWKMERMGDATNALHAVHKPVICKIQGYCLAGGTDLALACDMIIASNEAKIGFPAVRANGSPPNHMWIYHLGPQWAKRMLLSGDWLWGRDAAKLGLVMDALPAAELDQAVNDLAKRLTYVDAELMSANKRIVNLALELMGSRTIQRLAVETDARAHLCTGPRREQFKKDMAEFGLKDALKRRDAPFGDNMVKLGSAGDK